MNIKLIDFNEQKPKKDTPFLCIYTAPDGKQYASIQEFHDSGMVTYRILDEKLTHPKNPQSRDFKWSYMLRNDQKFNCCKKSQEMNKAWNKAIGINTTHCMDSDSYRSLNFIRDFLWKKLKKAEKRCSNHKK